MAEVRVLADRVDSARGMFVRGDVVTGPENDLRPLVDAKAAEWVDAEHVGTEGWDRRVWSWSVPSAREQIAAESDPAVLREWLSVESRNPRHPPTGRSGVRRALEQRLHELGPLDRGE